MKDPERSAALDAVGVGSSNLSLAALAHPVPTLQRRFFEQQSELSESPGLLFSDSVIRVSFLKDLVILVDPTSPFSLLAFPRHHRRLDRFLAGVDRWVTPCED